MQVPLDMFSAVFVTIAVLAALAGLFTVGVFIVDGLLGGNKHDKKD